MADESSVDPQGFHLLQVSSDHHLFSLRIKRIVIPIMTITIMALEKKLPCLIVLVRLMSPPLVIYNPPLFQYV